MKRVCRSGMPYLQSITVVTVHRYNSISKTTFSAVCRIAHQPGPVCLLRQRTLTGEFALAKAQELGMRWIVCVGLYRERQPCSAGSLGVSREKTGKAHPQRWLIIEY